MSTTSGISTKLSVSINALVVDFDISTSIGRLQAVLHGLTGSEFRQLAQVVGGAAVFAQVLRTDTSNLAHYFGSDKLTKSDTDAVIDTLKVYMQAADTFGSLELVDEWMKTNILILGGEKPMNLLDTGAGREVVLQTLHKLEYGEFS